MVKKYCNNCYFSGRCSADEVCEDYISLDEQLTDKAVDELISRGREKFRREWHQYITGWNI